jgi:WD40 repeat protein
VTGVTQPPPVPQPRLDRTVPECPYVGLVPFDESDAPYFFGRQRERDLIVANLTASRLTLLYAASGIGKSSVLRAGVLPRLRQIAAESYDDLGVPDAAVVYIREWSLAPLETIATEVLRAVSRVPGAAPVEVPGPPRLSVPWLHDVLQRSGVAAVYLVLDQFEEYFLYHPDDRGEGGLTSELGRILSTRDLPVNVLLSIREDALAALDRFKGRVPRLYDNYLRLAHLGRHAAQTAIEGPLDHYNQVVPPDSAMAVEPELTVTLLDQVRTGHLVVAPEGVASGGAADGREDIEAPYLQLVLTRLWEAERASGSSVLRRSTLDELGGAQTIVQTHLHTVMAGLSPDQTEVAAAVFHYLVTTSGTKIALTAQDLADLSGVPVSSVRELLQSLSAGRRSILRPVPPPAGVAGPPRYEIFHDVMGAAVLDWRRQYAQAEAARKLEEARAEAQATRRRLRQTRLLAAGLAIALLVAGVLGVLVYSANGRLAKQQSRSEALSKAAEYLDENPAESLRNAVDAYRISPDDDTRQAVLIAASAPRGRVVAGPPVDKEKVAGMVATPDQRHVVTYDAQGGIRVIDDERRLTKAAKVAGLAGTVVTADTDPRASHIALGTDGGSAVVVNVGTGTPVNLTTDGSPVLAVYWLDSFPDNLVLVVSSSGPAATYSATTGRQVARFPGTGNRALPIADDHVVTSDQDSRLRVWNARTGGKVAESSPLPKRAEYLRRYGNEVVGISGHNIVRWDGQSPEPRQYPVTGFSPALALLTVNEHTHTAAVALDTQVATYNLDNGSAQRLLPPQPDWVQDVALDPHGQWIVTAGADGRVRMWSATGNKTLSRATYDLIARHGSVRSVSYLRDGKALVSLSADGTVLLWDIPPVQRFHVSDNLMRDFDISADGRWLAAASADGKVYIVNLAGASTVPPVATIPVGDSVGKVKFDPTDPHRVVTLSWYRKQPQGWRWDSGRGAEQLPEFRIPRSFSPHYLANYLTNYLTSVNISQDGKWVAAEDYRGNVYRWDAHTGTLVGDPELKGSGIADYSGIAFDSSGKILAATSPAGVRLKNLDTWKERNLLSLPDVSWVAFDQRGEYIVGAVEDRGDLRVWRTRDGQRIQDLTAEGSTVGRPSFSGDGRLVAVGTGEGLIEVWDVHSGRKVILVRQHSGTVYDVLFLPGGRSRLVSASNDSTVAMFDCQACDDPYAVIREADRWVKANPN